MTKSQVASLALDLPRDDRAELAADLIASLEGAARREVEYREEWLVEAEDRRQQLLTGKVQAVPAEEVFAKLEARRRG